MKIVILNHTLGFHALGYNVNRKSAGKLLGRQHNVGREELLAVGRELRARHWQQQRQAEVDWVPVGDFAWYDQVLTTSLLLGNVPAHHQNSDGCIDFGHAIPHWPWPCAER